MRTLRELKKLARENLNTPKMKVALLGDTATQLLVTAIQGESVDRGFSIDLYEGEYSQVERQLMDPTSELYHFGAEVTIIFQSTHKLGELHSFLTMEQQEHLADERLSFVSSLCESPLFANKKIVYFNYPEIEDTVFGSYANKVESSFSYQVRKLNYELMNLSKQYPNLFIYCRFTEYVWQAFYVFAKRLHDNGNRTQRQCPSLCSLKSCRYYCCH